RSPPHGASSTTPPRNTTPPAKASRTCCSPTRWGSARRNSSTSTNLRKPRCRAHRKYSSKASRRSRGAAEGADRHDAGLRPLRAYPRQSHPVGLSARRFRGFAPGIAVLDLIAGHGVLRVGTTVRLDLAIRHRIVQADLAVRHGNGARLVCDRLRRTP